MISVVIPAVGNVELTKACIESVRATATKDIEVVLVDNGSTPEESEALKALGAEAYLHFDDMLGFPAAINRGDDASGGDWLLLLNNDTEIATPGWDALLTEAAGDGLTIVSPVLDFVFNRTQYVGSCAEEIAATDLLCFVAVLMRRTTWDAIGELDERFGLGNWEDNDYCLRLKQAGGQALVDPRVFVHHAGHATNSKIMTAEQFQTLLDENGAKFKEKWANVDRLPD